MATKVVDLGSVIGPQGPAGPQGATGPKGATGAQGPAGKDGTNGKSAYQQAVDAGYTGTEAAFYAALVSLKDGPFAKLKYGSDVIVPSRLEIGKEGIAPGIESFYGADGSDAGFILMDSIGDQPCRFCGVAGPKDPDDAANKEYVDGKTLVFTAKTIAVSAWTANTTYSAQGYGFRASVACAGVTANHRPDVAFGAADAVGGNFAPFCDSYTGGVYIYCKEKPTATVTIPSIVCVKGA